MVLKKYVITDVFTKLIQAVPTRDQKAKTVAKRLVKEWFVRYGVPERIHSVKRTETSRGNIPRALHHLWNEEVSLYRLPSEGQWPV